MKVRALLRLMRFDKPVGTLLLWFPVAWALWISSHGHPKPFLVWYFFLGTVVMRAAGCVMNDLADRHIDKHVKRTQFRPITAGDIGFFEAILLLVALLLLAFWVLIHLPISCFFIAILALLTTLAYPFGKRFLQAPQLILSIAFSIAIPMVYVAQAHRLDAGFVWLFALNVAWVVAYDTMYAMADKADDLTIGIHSTAIFLVSLIAWRSCFYNYLHMLRGWLWPSCISLTSYFMAVG